MSVGRWRCPDGWRADFISRELNEFEERGEFPQLTVICLPQDHTSGTSPGCPTPRGVRGG